MPRRPAHLAAIALAVSALAAGCGGGAGDGGAADSAARLVPRVIPPGLVLCHALDLPRSTSPTLPATSNIAIWGDASRADPWAGPLVGIFVNEGDGDGVPVHDDAVEITVQGIDGYVAPMALFQAVSSEEWGHIVTWRAPAGAVVEVAARGASPDEARRIAGLVDVDGAAVTLPTDALGPDTVPIYEGYGVAPYAASANVAWTLQYRAENLSEGREAGLVTVSGLRGGRDELSTLRFWAVASDPFGVRGHQGLAYAAFDDATGPFGIAWQEAPGLLIQVVGLGLDKEVVRDVTGSLEAVDAKAWRAIKEDGIDPGCESGLPDRPRPPPP